MMECLIQKYWIEGKGKKNCFMLYARDLKISLAESQTNNHWTWLSDIDQTSRFEFFDEKIVVFQICFLLRFHWSLYICLQ